MIGCGSLYKIAQLSSGGKAVALLVGGQEIQQNTRNLRERRILNVVEEMAIASGVPVPPVYLLPDEMGINAFAAGHAPGDAVVAVSQGCLDYLTRDELQGVIGHEFSHILNGDMRLNIRLMGLIFGLLVLSLVGYYIMDASSRSRSSSKDKGAGQLFFVGLGLYILGSLGAFFGTLIQAAISRQREYLADASSIQFTRNPEGIGGALKKIGGLSEGSAIKNPGKVEVAHMFFADGFKSRFIELLASHPPLPDRIRRIDPHWDGKYPQVKQVDVDADETREPGKGRVTPKMPVIPGLPQMPIPVMALDSGSSTPLSTVGDVQTAIPDVLREASHEAFSARALIYALLLDRKPEIRDKQLAHIQAEADPKDVKETIRLQNFALELNEAARLPLIDMSMPALRQMSPQQYQTFRDQMQFLIDADHQLSLFEYTLSCMLTNNLDQAFQLQPKPAIRYRSASALIQPVNRVLSVIAWEGADNDEAALTAYQTGMRQFVSGGELPSLLPRSSNSLAYFDRALKVIRESLPALKQNVVKACWACITADGKVTVRESELLRAICAVLGTPRPS